MRYRQKRASVMVLGSSLCHLSLFFVVVVFVLGYSPFSTELIIPPIVKHMQYHFLTTFLIMLLFIHSFVDKSNE